MSTRSRQVARYRRSLSYAVKSKARARAITQTVQWVRHFHPHIWQQFLDEATTDEVAKHEAKS